MSNSIMLSSLPICAAFRSKSNSKYLRSCANHGEGADGRVLQLTGDDAENPLTRFFVETSCKHDGLVHIRCSYNKYWVAEKRHGEEWWIAGSADKPEEDLSELSCTLFQLKPVKEDPKTIRFYHARLGKYFGILSNSNGENETDKALLSAQSLHNNPVLVFESEDIKDPTVMHTITPNRDGTMRIKSDHFDGFWRNSDSTNLGPWILADSSDTNNDDPNTLFQAWYTGGAFRLLNLGSNQYCKRLTMSNLEHGLSATGTRLEPWSHLQIEEPVLSRKITAFLRSENAVIFGEKLLNLATASVTNNTSSVMPRVKLTLDYTLMEMKAWQSKLHFKSPVPTLIISENVYMQYGFIAVSPMFFNGPISWGASNVKSFKVTEERFIDVPPMTKMTITCMGVTSNYELPFSYRQTDELVDGEMVTLQYDDGLYTGRNVHSFICFRSNECRPRIDCDK